MRNEGIGRAPALVVAVSAAALVVSSAAAVPSAAQPPATGRRWTAEFPRPWPAQELRSVGSYKEGPVVVNFESLSPLLLEPPPSAAWSVVTAGAPSGRVSFRDTKPGLMPNRDAGAEPFYKRAEGAITAMAWVDQVFGDAQVTVRVNTTGGPRRQGSSSRQGPLLRWDKGSNWVWCAVNFAGGTVSIVRAQHFGIMKDIEGSERPIRPFNNRRAYDVTFSATGQELICQVLDRGTVVADTGRITDPAPLMRGVSGVLFELSLDKPYVPLEGSFDLLTSVELPGR